MAQYYSPAVLLLADEITQQILTDLAAAIPGISLEDDSRLVILAGVFGLAQAVTQSKIVDQADKRIEQTATAFGRPQRDAVPATVQGTITASGTAVQTVQAGDLYRLDTPSGDQALLNVSVGASTAGGSSNSTAAGAVTFVFQQGGAQFNELTGTLTIVADVNGGRPTWFLSGATAAPSSGGSDAEGATEYRDKAVAFLQQIKPGPITASDWESAVLDAHPSIGRALVLETFDSADTTGGALGTTKALAFTVVPATAGGAAVGTDAKAAVAAIPRLSDVILRINDPDLSSVNVTMTVYRRPEYTSAQCKAEAEAALALWLSPAYWGGDTDGERASWHVLSKVRIKVAEAVVARCLSVDYVSPTVNTTLQVVGVDGSPQTTDRTLPGRAPLAQAGTITVTVLDPA